MRRLLLILAIAVLLVAAVGQVMADEPLPPGDPLSAILTGVGCDDGAEIGSMVVSMGDPGPAVVERYNDFNADFVMVWEAHEAEYWAPHDVVIWLDGNGQQVNVTENGRERVPYVDVPVNVIAAQIGDEPCREDLVPSYELRETWGPEFGYTNFSYWAPLNSKPFRWPEFASPDIVAEYDQGHRLSVSEYNLTPVHVEVLMFYREHCLQYDMECWTYLNAYDGQETIEHSESDMRWTTNVALALGYEGYIWWSYNMASLEAFPENHAAANAQGGAIIHELGTWNETPYWQMIADLNDVLHQQSAALDGQRSTKVTVRRDTITGEFGPLHTVIMNNTNDFQGTAKIITVEVPENWEAIGDPVLQPGAAVVLRHTLLDIVR
jgi:hypothetical protein